MSANRRRFFRVRAGLRFTFSWEGGFELFRTLDVSACGAWVMRHVPLSPLPPLGTEGESWVNAEDIRVAEYWRIERKPRTLCMLADGSVGWKDTLPPGLPPEIIVRERPSFVRQLKYWKLTATEVLEQRDLPGKWLPIIPVYG
jgi:hypothetical protein